LSKEVPCIWTFLSNLRGELSDGRDALGDLRG
jgi:hypothetical protein